MKKKTPPKPSPKTPSQTPPQIRPKNSPSTWPKNSPPTRPQNSPPPAVLKFTAEECPNALPPWAVMFSAFGSDFVVSFFGGGGGGEFFFCSAGIRPPPFVLAPPPLPPPWSDFILPTCPSLTSDLGVFGHFHSPPQTPPAISTQACRLAGGLASRPAGWSATWPTCAGGLAA